MPFQTDNLVMVGLGVVHDQPPNTVQPKLAPGIHLRWAFDPSRAFPWWGYYLFRRPHDAGTPICLAARFPQSWKQGAAVGQTVMFSAGSIYSDAPLTFLERFVPTTTAEFDLRQRQWWRLQFSAGTYAREFRVTLGFIDREGRVPVPIKDGDRPDDTDLPRGCVPFLGWWRALMNALNLGQPTPLRVRVRALDDVTIVTEGTAAGPPGSTVTLVLAGDRMNAVEIDGANAAVIDICYVPADQNVALGWTVVPAYTTVDSLQNPVSGPAFPYPMGLPSAASGYPCVGKPTSAAAAEAMALARVRYGPASAWSATVGQYRQTLDDLVVAGPSGLPQADRFSMVTAAGSLPNAPTMPGQYPLDLVLMASLNPAFAMMSGLYWIDDPDASGGLGVGQAWDYLILADHGNRFHGDPSQALAAMAQPLPADVDGWVCYGLKKEDAAPLPAPAEPQAFVLPGGATTPAVIATGNVHTVGLRWRIDSDPNGELPPGAPVGYHVWHKFIGGTEPAAPVLATDHTLVTTTGMVIATAPTPSVTGQPPPAPQWPSDWPQLPMCKIVGGLQSGWHSYRYSAVDLFGRHSTWSAPAAWRQWAPEPLPRPWYYVGAAADADVKPWAVELRDTDPPPRPTGVEARALDPKDPDLNPPIGVTPRDAVFDAWAAGGWWAGLPATQPMPAPGKAEVVGLKVSWLWTAAQMAQAPDVAEFRIYFHPGSNPPTSYVDRLNWQERVFVCPYAQHVTVVTPTNGDPPFRRYEVLLPVDQGQTFRGAPLHVTETDPVLYANIGVTAVDNAGQTADDAKWASGFWGGRNGNESGVAGPAMIYRVLREAPPAPVVVDTSDIVWATRADFHDRSFYTVRWPVSGTYKAHLFRAMDETLYRADWDRRWMLKTNPQLTPPNPATGALSNWTATDLALALQDLADVDAECNAHAAKVPFTTPSVLAVYRKLGDRAQRLMAGLEGNEAAFTQITWEPLDPTLADNFDRIGPDGLTPHTPSASLRAWLAELDGKARNRWFFRAAYVNAAHTMGPLGPSSPPVCLPRVKPPITPAVKKVLGGDRQITLTWVSNREADLAEYRVYRAEDERDARDVRRMTLVHVEAAPAVPPATLSWADTSVTDAKTYHYRITARDGEGNESAPCAAIMARAYSDERPAPPTWDIPASSNVPMQLDLSWTSSDATLSCRVERSAVGTAQWAPVSGWLARGVYAFSDKARVANATYDYRLRVIDSRGRGNAGFNILSA